MMPKTSVNPAASRNNSRPSCRPFRNCSTTSSMDILVRLSVEADQSNCFKSKAIFRQQYPGVCETDTLVGSGHPRCHTPTRELEDLVLRRIVNRCVPKD